IFLFYFVSWLSILKAEESESISCTTNIDSSNMDSEVSKYHTSVFLFHVPWCGHCQRFKPEYEAVCEDIKKEMFSSVMCASITIKIMRGSYECEYIGPRERKDLFYWVRSILNGAVDITSIEKIKELLDSSEYSVVGYLDVDHPHRDLGQAVTCDMTPLNYLVISDPLIAEKLGINQPNTFSVFNKQIYVKTLREIIDKDSLALDIFSYIHPLVPDYSPNISHTIFSDQMKHYLTYIYDSPESLEERKEVLHSLATSKLSIVRVFTINSADEINKDVVEYFHAPKLPLVLFYNDETQKYFHYEGEDVSVESLDLFIKGCLDGSIPAFIKRQPVPEDWDKSSVKDLVFDTFYEPFKSHQYGMVLFHAPWCGHCKAFMSIWAEFADLVESKYPEVFVGRIDHTQNEILGITISGYPTIIAFKTQDDKIVYDGARTLEELEQFVVKTFFTEEPVPKTPEVSEESEEEHEEL
ncbi:hypothetical protein MXB_5050, partial [Myxobolus squamalis]